MGDRIGGMRRFLGVTVVVFAAAVVMAGPAVAQTPSPASTNPGWFTQPVATVLTGVLAVFAATIAFGGVLLNRRQTEKHFTGRSEEHTSELQSIMRSSSA